MPASIDRFLNRAFQDQADPLYHKVNDVLAVIILLSVGLVIAESVDSIRASFSGFFAASEWIIVAIFTLEYIIYIYLARKKIRYIFSLFGIIDLLAILPTYLALFFAELGGAGGLRVLRVLRVLRLLRLFRLLKLVRYSRHPQVGKGTLREIPWYNLEIYFFALFSVVIISGTLIYLAERAVQGTPFVNIPAGLWWAIVTITTVGYGDMVPATVLGKVIAAFTMISGLALFALLVSVMGGILQKLLFGGPVDMEK